MSQVTQLLQAIDGGDQKAVCELLPLVYDELRQLAAQKLAQERPGQTLQPTALVHEAYLRLIGPDKVLNYANRRHFFGAAATAMRRILVETARRKKRDKHGGSRQPVTIELDQLAQSGVEAEFLLLHEMLVEFAEVEPQKAKLVELRFFGGLTLKQAAECQQISLSTADRAWRYARAWLYAAMAKESAKQS